MKPLLYIGSLFLAVSSCSNESTGEAPASPSSRGNKRDFLVKDLTTASISEHRAQKLLRDTVIPHVDWPDQSIIDRLSLIDREAFKIGLSVEASPGLRNHPMKCSALRVRNIPFVAAIQATVDSTILRVRTKDSGVLFFYLASEERSSPVPREANDPFSGK